jgi:hypothetical protein
VNAPPLRCSLAADLTAARALRPPAASRDAIVRLDVVPLGTTRLVVVDGAMPGVLGMPRCSFHRITPLLDSPACRGNGSIGRGAEQDGTAGVGHQTDPVDSPQRLSPARRWDGEKRTYGGLSGNSGRQLFFGLSRSTERLRQAREHHKIGVESDPFRPANAKRGKARSVR